MCSEVWGIHPAPDIELIHTKFLRRLLGVRKSTNLTALYGELHRVPMYITRKINMIKYWAKMLCQKDSSLIKRTYLFLLTEIDTNANYNQTNWAFQIKSILEEHGLNNIWLTQHTRNSIPIETIKQRIIDNYLQKWYSEINNSTRLQHYCIFKHDFNLEKYLEIHLDRKYVTTLSRFRTSSHSLFIESGRYDGTPREQRLCKSCTMNAIESEYHFLLVCPNYKDLRKKYFKPYFCHWPTLNKFRTLMSSTSKYVINNLSKYIYSAFQIRTTE